MNEMNNASFVESIDLKKEEFLKTCIRIQEFITFCDQELKDNYFSDNQYSIFPQAINSNLSFDDKTIAAINYIYELTNIPISIERHNTKKLIIIRKLIS